MLFSTPPRTGFRFRQALVLLALFAAAFGAPALEIQPTGQEMRSERRWLKDHVLERHLKSSEFSQLHFPAQRPEPGLDVYANHDAVIPNRRGASPLKIGDREYSRGLYCHAVSRVEARLPGPGKRFSALVGLDHNDDTARGQGSVVFKVSVNDKVVFQSEVMRFGTPAREINVDLDGAETFTLEVGDAGDGIGWDQADWAEAKATLADGREVWLGDMPLRDHRAEVDAGFAPIVRGTKLPFSFVYGGRSSDDWLAVWPKKTLSTILDSHRRQRAVTWTDPRSGLEVQWVCVEYNDFPACEWTVYFTNTGPANTLILENVQGLDTTFDRKPDGEFALHGNKGDWCAPQSYEPYQTALGPGTNTRFAPDGGRPTNGPKGWPYFNLQMPGGGCLLAIGWPGQWACAFARDDQRSLRVTAGQQLTHLYLQPGESIRAPLIALLFWRGTDTVRAQNLWRRWFMAHNLPRLNGRPPPAMTQMQCYRTFEKGGEQDLFNTVTEFNQAHIPFDLCWRDAGWYPCRGNWPNTGSWELDPERYPKGFRPFSDWLHEQGKKFIVWFEPERVGDKESWLAKQHPDWLLSGNLLNLGNPEAWKWLVERIDTLRREQGIDYYRQDFNMDPLANWRANDAPDRRGMTENQHVKGYLAFWDELRRRHPGLLIDSCASGGRRNDLETLRRAVPLLRSDYQFGHEATLPNQGHTYGISSWIPYYGSGCAFTDPYSARSYIMPCSGYGGTNAETKRAYEECGKAAPFMLGDYYPLTPYTLDTGDWIAWQFDRPEMGGGLVQAFRREKNTEPARALRLHGLAPSATYELTDLDKGASQRMTGKDLASRGVTVAIPGQPGAALILYRKVRH